MNKTKKIFIILIGILWVLTAACIAYYFFIASKPKSIFNTILNRTYTAIDKSLLTSDNSIIGSDKLAIKGNLKINNSTNDVLSKYNYSYDYNIDKQNKKASLNLNVNKETQSILNALLIANNNSAYLSLPNIYNKAISLGDITSLWENYSNSKSVSNDDVRYIISFIKDSTINHLKDSDFKLSYKDITINNKKTKAKNNELKLDATRLKELANEIVDEIDKDSKAKKIISNLVGIQESKIINILKGSIKHINDSFGLNIYSKCFSTKIIRITLIEKNKEIIVFDKYDNVLDISYVESGSKISIIKENKHTIIKILNSNKDLATINITENTSSSLKATFAINIPNQPITGTFDLTINKTETSITTKCNSTITINGFKTTIDLDTIISNNPVIPAINTNNAIDMTNINQTEQELISKNLMENEFISDISNMIKSVIPQASLS